MNKYAIYTQGNTYPVLEKDGNYYIAPTGTGHFSGQWKFLGVKERLKGVKNIIKPEEALKITDWKFKNGSPRYQVVDLDHGTIRIWAGTSADQQLSSFGNISDNMFDVITGIKSDDEITLEESQLSPEWQEDLKDNPHGYSVYEFRALRYAEKYGIIDYKVENDKMIYIEKLPNEGDFEHIIDLNNMKEIEVNQLNESKKYNIYATYGGDGVYNSKLVDTVDSEEQAVDRVAELQATGVGASYEEVETKNEECSQASGVASGVNGKIDSFPINPKEMEKQRLKEDIDNPYFVVEDIGGLYIMAGPFKTIEEARNKRKEQIEEYNLKEEADIIFAWSWNRISKYYIERYGEDNPYNNYQEFINGAECAPYYKEEKLEESKEDDIFNAREELINYLNQNTKYEWDANESYDNCAITESETDYIEVFVDIKDGNKIYTVDNYSYNSLEELVKNMPVLFTDEDEDYDYDSNWEDLDESINDKNLDWIYDENEKLYHCEIDNWYFNIYELEDGTYNLIVDYDEEELQDLDDIFDTLEEAKKKAQEIYNKGISEYNGDDFAGFEYETESKDLTKTLHEMALLEDYEEGNISPQKQKFIDYCKDKIEDLGDVEIYDEDYEENIQYHKLMHTEGIREFEDLYIIADFDNYENENLIAINNENKIVINTPMIDCNGYAGTMQFDKIDKKFYDQLMDYWDDLYMDEIIEEE